MISMKLIFLASALIIVSTLVLNVESLKCFVCNSHDHPECSKKNVDLKFLIDCDLKKKDGLEYTLCRKTNQIIEFSVNGLPAETRIIRSCGGNMDRNASYINRCYRKSGFGGQQEVCSCDTDNCNGATTLKATFGVLMAFAVVIISQF